MKNLIEIFVKCYKNNNKKAFTLAEVLITLTILGVIAAIVIPNVVNSYQKMITIVRLKKHYAKINNTMEEIMAVNNCSNLSCVFSQNNSAITSSFTNTTNKMRILFPDIKYDGDKNDTHKCSPSTIHSWQGADLGKTAGDGKSKIHFCLPDGTGLAVHDASFSTGTVGTTCKTNPSECATFYLYTNGAKKKAMFGKNVFVLFVDTDGNVNVPALSSAYPCSKTSNSAKNGIGCMDSIIKNNWKMNY